MRRRVITRVTTSVRSCLAAKTSSGTARSIPFRYNRRSCHCLPVSIKRDIRIPLIAFKPGQQCLSEAIFHLRLHIPLSLGTPYIKVLRGFPCSVVYTCTLFFHEFSIWENRNTFPVVCKRGNINLRLLYISQFWFRISRWSLQFLLLLRWSCRWKLQLLRMFCWMYKLLFPGLLPERELAVIPCSGLSLKLLLPGFRRFLLFLQLLFM